MSIKSVLSAIEEYGMLENGDKVVVGLSGGADSVCLLSILSSLKEEYSLTLTAAHINHGIRGEEADRDEAYCVKLCNELCVPIEVLHADIPTLAKNSGTGEEECGRRVRYEFFSSLAGENGKIATAHNLNDNAETLILNLVRGAGLKGACSIPPVRDNIIRPLIKTDRKSIEDYCKANNLYYVTDSTNAQNEYSRNKIRNTVMPVLEEINSNAVKSLNGFIELSRQEERFIEKIAEAEYERCVDNGRLCEESFSALDECIKKRVAAKFLKQMSSGEITSRHIEDLIDFSGSKKSLVSASALKLVSRNGYIYAPDSEIQPFEVKISLENGVAELPHKKIRLEIADTKDLQNLNKELLDNLIDCDKISNTLIFRSRRDGDKITLGARNVTKTLKKLFNEDKIPVEERNAVVVLDSDGEAVWVQGYGTSKKFRVGASTKRALKLGEDDG